MYVRTISRRNKDGSTTTYVQLAHNVWDPQTSCAKANVLYTFGRADSLDLESIRRLVKSLCRFLSPEDALQAQASLGKEPPALRFLKSVPLGGAFVLRRLWERLGLPGVLAQALKERQFQSPVDWAIFAMVANRALAPDSKRGVEEWVREDVALGNPAPLGLQHLYRAMDFLREQREAVQKEVFFATADLLNLEVDLLFFDTTSTYIERYGQDETGLRRYGYSRDHRPDLPQVVIGLAVTKEGIPVRCWVLPGNTQDLTTVEQVKKDLSGWKLSRCLWVMDGGMNSERNRAILQQAGGHYIIGEKLRDSQAIHQEALCAEGHLHKVRDNLYVKEVVVGQGERRRRFVLVYNPEQAKKDKARREQLLQRIAQALGTLGNPRKDVQKATRRLLAHGKMGPYLRQLKSGKLKINRMKVRAEEALDGKFLVSTSDDSLSPEDVALGYKQLLEVERAFRTLKTTLDLRPVYHRKDERIEAHVFLCFLALLLVRVAERQTGQTWDRIRAVLERIHLGEFFSTDGCILQRTELTPDQIKLLKQLDIPSPAKIQRVDIRS